MTRNGATRFTQGVELPEGDGETIEAAGPRGRLTIETARAYAFAGRAVITAVNLRTQGRMTYKLIAPRTKRDGREVHFVRVRTGGDLNAWEFVGTVFDKTEYRHSHRSILAASSKESRGFEWILARLVGGDLPAEFELYHEGTCGRCGRTLTVPESIESGIGPECAKIRAGGASRRERGLADDAALARFAGVR